MRSWAGLAGVFALGASLAGWQGQPPGPQGQKPPTFRSAVELIAVDVNVVDRNGQPVAGLDAEQFEVSVDGSPRRVAWATFLDYAAAQADRPANAAGQAGARPVEGSYGSNEVPEAEVDAVHRDASSCWPSTS